MLMAKEKQHRERVEASMSLETSRRLSLERVVELTQGLVTELNTVQGRGGGAGRGPTVSAILGGLRTGAARCIFLAFVCAKHVHVVAMRRGEHSRDLASI